MKCGCKNGNCNINKNNFVKCPTYAVDGGIGKHVMFTSMIPALVKKSKQKMINIVTPYPDVYIGIEGIQYVFLPEQQDSAEFKMSTSDLIFREPYRGNFKLKGDKHLCYYWSKELGISYDPKAKPLPPKIQDEELISRINSIKEEVGKYILVQFTGGQSPIGWNPDSQYQIGQMHIQRNYPYEFANLLVDKIKAKYPECTIIDYSLPNEHPGYRNAIRLDLPYIAYSALCKDAFAIICIDSSLSHFAASQRKQAIVLYGGIPSWQFGWDSNINLTNYDGKDEFNPFDPYYISIDTNKVLEELEKIKKIEGMNNG